MGSAKQLMQSSEVGKYICCLANMLSPEVDEPRYG